MTEIVWDQVSERRYETGIDRGVLYLTDGPVVPWNGLVSVTETTGREVKSFYLDGAKYLDQHILGPYEAKLRAFTYPDELDTLVGTPSYAPGVRVHDQKARPFHLAYRTKVGSELDGTDHGYKLHVIYNVLAVPSDTTFATLDASAAVTPLEWTLMGRPSRYVGFNPASGFHPAGHISFDSRQMDPAMLAAVEAQIYGTEIADPSLPPLDWMLILASTGILPG